MTRYGTSSPRPSQLSLMTRRRLLRSSVVAGGATTAAMLAGCSGSNNSTTKPAATSGAATQTAKTPAGAVSTPSAQAPAPVPGGVIQKAINSDMAFDLLQLISTPALSFTTVVYSSLLTTKGYQVPEKTNSFEVTGDLIAQWQQPDPVTYTLHIQPDAKFHPKPPTNGRTVTSEDITQSYQRYVSEPKNAYRTQFDIVDSITALDPQTVQFKTKTPYSPFLSSLLAYHQYFYVWPKELLQNDALRTSNPVGSGPYMFKSTQNSTFWEFERNPIYYGKDDAGRQLPFLDGVRYNVIPDENQRLSQFLAGNIDELGAISEDNISQVKSQVKGVQVVQPPGGKTLLVQPQQRSGPFKDPRARQAVSMAVDRDALILLASPKGSGGWNNFVGYAEGDWYLDPRSAEAGPASANFKYNPTEAKKLITAAGLTGTFEFAYAKNGALSDLYRQMSLAVIDYLRRVGLDVKPVPMDYQTEWLAPGGKGGFFGEFKDLFANSLPAFPHAHVGLKNSLGTNGTHNSQGSSDQMIDSMLADLGQEFNFQAAVAKAHAIQKYAMDPMYLIPLSSGRTNSAWQGSIKNWIYNPPYSDDEIKQAWKSKS